MGNSPAPPPYDCFAVGPTAFLHCGLTATGPCSLRSPPVPFRPCPSGAGASKNAVGPTAPPGRQNQSGALLRTLSVFDWGRFGRGRAGAPPNRLGAIVRQRCWGIFGLQGCAGAQSAFGAGRTFADKTAGFLRGRKKPQLASVGAGILPVLSLDEPAACLAGRTLRCVHPFGCCAFALLALASRCAALWRFCLRHFLALRALARCW